MGKAAAVVLGFLGQAERALAEPGGDHDGAAGVAFAVGGLDCPRAGAGELHHFAEAQLDAGLRCFVGQLRGDLRAVGVTLDLVQLGEIDEGATRRELVEAKSF